MAPEQCDAGIYSSSLCAPIVWLAITGSIRIKVELERIAPKYSGAAGHAPEEPIFFNHLYSAEHLSDPHEKQDGSLFPEAE
jgi:hypothetical protein